MARYDGRGGYRGSAYDSDFGRWGDEWGSRPGAGFRGRGAGLYRPWGTPPEPRGRGGYDRAGYGDAYPRYAGDYLRRPLRYRGYDEPYAGDYRGGRFIPEQAYRMHPELDRPRRATSDRWPDRGHDIDDYDEMDDAEVRQTVRQNLYGDDWLDPETIDVEVEQGVVTLRGEVADYMEARYAWDDAWESPGVRGVVNLLSVRSDPRDGAHGEVLPQTE